MCPNDFLRAERSPGSFSAGCASELGTRVLFAIDDMVGSDACGLDEVVGVGFEGPFVRLRFLEPEGASRASMTFIGGDYRCENQERSREDGAS